MKRLKSMALLLALPFIVSAQSISNPSSIDYAAQKKNLSGNYSLSYENSEITAITNNGNCRFDFFTADSYKITYPESTKQKVEVTNSAGEYYAYFTYSVLGPNNIEMDYYVRGAGFGDVKFTKEQITNTCNLDGYKRPLEIVSKGKFDDKGVKSITMTVNGSKFKTKIDYTDVMYFPMFDYMSFIMYNFLGIQAGYFEFWPCLATHQMTYYPKTVENNGVKFQFDYNFLSKDYVYIEVKMVKDGKMEERYIFKVNK